MRFSGVRIDEVGAFIATLLATPSYRLTACRGWTAHELVADLAAGAAEEADLIDEHLAGRERTTRPLEERERPFRELEDPLLRDRLVEEAARLTVALEHLGEQGPSERVRFTGRLMTAEDFAMHSRSECALHRWDLVGRDDVGWAALAQPELTRHAASVLTSMATLPEAPANRLVRVAGPERAELRIVVRSALRHDDVVVTLRGDDVTIAQTPIDETAPDVELDPAARLLLLWGRREPTAPVNLYGNDRARRALVTLFGC